MRYMGLAAMVALTVLCADEMSGQERPAYRMPVPSADAGRNKTTHVGENAILDGRASTNSSGVGTLTYNWDFISRPEGSLAALTNPGIAPEFTPDLPGEYVIRLIVNNGHASSTSYVRVSTINSAPVADAGFSQTAKAGSTVTLNGGASTDVDGDPVTYRWNLIDVPPGSVAALRGANTISPTFVADKEGTYRARLTVNDGKVDSVSSDVLISTVNTAPVARAGSHRTARAGDVVQLDGAGSTDVDGNALTYKWALITLPPESNAALSDSEAVNPTFVIDLAGTYIAQLIVNDGFIDSAPATVTVTTTSVLPPRAHAGLNRTVGLDSIVTLDGSASPAGSAPLSLRWSLISRPADSSAILSGAGIANPTFIADKPGQYVAQLIVTDGVHDSSPSTVVFTTTNTPPVADAGVSQTVSPGSHVLLDGSRSSDADHDSLNFAWALLSRPERSTAALAATDTVSPMLAADEAGTYVVQVIAHDG